MINVFANFHQDLSVTVFTADGRNMEIGHFYAFQRAVMKSLVKLSFQNLAQMFLDTIANLRNFSRILLIFFPDVQILD